jgi:hypothetical protein
MVSSSWYPKINSIKAFEQHTGSVQNAALMITE